MGWEKGSDGRTAGRDAVTAAHWQVNGGGVVEAGPAAERSLHAVVSVNQGDEGNQRCQLVLVVVVDRVRPGLVGGHRPRRRCACPVPSAPWPPARPGERRGLTPGRDQVETYRGLPAARGVFGVHVGAEAAAVDLVGPDLHQFLRRGRQSRLRDDLACSGGTASPCRRRPISHTLDGSPMRPLQGSSRARRQGSVAPGMFTGASVTSGRPASALSSARSVVSYSAQGSNPV